MFCCIALYETTKNNSKPHTPYLCFWNLWCKIRGLRVSFSTLQHSSSVDCSLDCFYWRLTINDVRHFLKSSNTWLNRKRGIDVRDRRCDGYQTVVVYCMATRFFANHALRQTRDANKCHKSATPVVIVWQFFEKVPCRPSVLNNTLQKCHAGQVAPGRDLACVVFS